MTAGRSIAESRANSTELFGTIVQDAAHRWPPLCSDEVWPYAFNWTATEARRHVEFGADGEPRNDVVLLYLRSLDQVPEAQKGAMATAWASRILADYVGVSPLWMVVEAVIMGCGDDAPPEEILMAAEDFGRIVKAVREAVLLGGKEAAE